MATTITSAGVTFTDTTTLTSANGVPSALKLTTARTINGVSFDGTGNITIPATSISGANVAKAWVNFNGTTSPGTIRSSFNVSSVTKNGTGDYTVNFTTAMADANYSIVLGGSRNNSAVDNFGMQFYSQATGSVRINTIANNSGYVDSPYACVSIFGN
jgi:hypothetical protein